LLVLSNEINKKCFLHLSKYQFKAVKSIKRIFIKNALLQLFEKGFGIKKTSEKGKIQTLYAIYSILKNHKFGISKNKNNQI